MKSNLELKEVSADENASVIAFVGEFDKAGFSENRAVLEGLSKKSKSEILVFDFSKLKFINSEGIGYLMELHASLKKGGRELIIVGPNAHVKDVFQAIGLDQVVKVQKTMKDLNGKK